MAFPGQSREVSREFRTRGPHSCVARGKVNRYCMANRQGLQLNKKGRAEERKGRNAINKQIEQQQWSSCDVVVATATATTANVAFVERNRVVSRRDGDAFSGALCMGPWNPPFAAK